MRDVRIGGGEKESDISFTYCLPACHPALPIKFHTTKFETLPLCHFCLILTNLYRCNQQMAESSRYKLLQLLWSSTVLREDEKLLLRFSSLWNQTDHQESLTQNCSYNLAHWSDHLQEKHYSYFSLTIFILNMFLLNHDAFIFPSKLVISILRNCKWIIVTIRRERNKFHFTYNILCEGNWSRRVRLEQIML